MDFEIVKENIQPLATGRDASLLQASLRRDSPQELLLQRQELEKAIANYTGDDPLEPWYSYICWIEQSYPSGGSGSGLNRALRNCLARFENDANYKQDRRLIKLFIKFAGGQKDQLECYQEMYNNGVGTMVSDFYIAWSYSYDLCGNTRQADEIFRRGIACRAEPLEDLKEAHQHFGFTISQRMLYTDTEEAFDVNEELNERRLALQSLHAHKRKGAVGSVRTGAAVRSERPGRLRVERDASTLGGRCGSNAARGPVVVFNDENIASNAVPLSTHCDEHPGDEAMGSGKTLRSIIDEARHQENEKTPGPWHNAQSSGNDHKLFGDNVQCNLGFTIHQDEQPSVQFLPITNHEAKIDKPFKVPPNFVARNRKQEDWQTPVTIENQPDPNTLPMYNKCMIYPRPNVEFQQEEWRAYKFFKKVNPQHPYVLRNHKYFTSGDANVSMRRYPNFACNAKPQDKDALDVYWRPSEDFKPQFQQYYDDSAGEECQLEELRMRIWRDKRNETINRVADMEETICDFETFPRRKSFFPTSASVRKSVAVSKTTSGRLLAMAEMSELHEEQQNVNETDKVEKIIQPNISHKTAASIPSSESITRSPPLSKIVIYEDSIQANVLLQSLPPAAAKPSAGFFDCDETCSTERFNICIGKQSVSTPNPASRQMSSVRQFGNLLKDTKSEQHQQPGEIITSDEDSSPGMAQNEYSDDGPRKQLSTILETSEYGTTQGTQSSNGSNGGTNATTKLASIISPNLKHAAIPPTLPLATPSELAGNIPEPTRLQQQFTQNFQDLDINSHGQPSPQQQQHQAGNFSRIEQREDTATQIASVNLLHRFQEDKTETIAKSLLRFEEDKTETISKMLLPSGLSSTGTKQISNAAAVAIPEMSCNNSLESFLMQSTPMADLGCKPKTVQGKNQAARSHASVVLFEDEANVGPLMNDSYLPDFSLNEPPPPPTTLPITRSYAIEDKENIPLSDVETAMAKMEVDLPGDSLMEDLSFVPETQAYPLANVQSSMLQNNFDIFLDTLPKTVDRACEQNNPFEITKPGQQACYKSPIDIYIDSTLPETQELPPTCTPAPTGVVSKKVSGLSGAVPHFSEANADGAMIPTLNFMQSFDATMASVGAAHLTASYMKDFAEISKQPVQMIENTDDARIQQCANSVKFLNDQSTANKFVNVEAATMKSAEEGTTKSNVSSNFFELNAATEMFATNLSMIKNSTLLPNHERNKITHLEECSAEKEASLCRINKTSANDHVVCVPETSKMITKNTTRTQTPNLSCSSISATTANSFIINETPAKSKHPIADKLDGDMSIYYKMTPRTPKQSQHVWNDDDYKSTLHMHSAQDKSQAHRRTDPDQTMQIVNKNLADVNVNPFSVDLTNAFLDSVDFSQYILKQPRCDLVRHVQCLKPGKAICIKEAQFEILKLIGEGAYGSIYSAKHTKTGRKYALKQERPPNNWEYYICLEVHSRILNEAMMPAYMDVVYALIGNNASILVMELSPYGSLISVCNKIKKHTTKNVDEFVVMHLSCQLLSIIDHLHSVKIIHADVKADNFLLMKPLNHMSDEPSLQLIDFGVSIDMDHFPEQQAFNYVHHENDIKCVEMRTNRPWSYQLDLFGLAGVIHVLLFGKHMEIEQRPLNGYWMPKERLPRYFNKHVWNCIFQTLLNIRDCSSMPNLQELRTLLKSELIEKEKYMVSAINEFNKTLKQ